MASGKKFRVKSWDKIKLIIVWMLVRDMKKEAFITLLQTLGASSSVVQQGKGYI